MSVDPRTHDLIRRLVLMVASFESPDGNHKALRSIYSPRGVCETTRPGHSDLCLAWAALVVEGAEWLEAQESRQRELMREAM